MYIYPDDPEAASDGSGTGGRVEFGPYIKSHHLYNDEVGFGFIVLGAELGHAYNADRGDINNEKWYEKGDRVVRKEEKLNHYALKVHRFTMEWNSTMITQESSCCHHWMGLSDDAPDIAGQPLR